MYEPEELDWSAVEDDGPDITEGAVVYTRAYLIVTVVVLVAATLAAIAWRITR